MTVARERKAAVASALGSLGLGYRIPTGLGDDEVGNP